MPTPQGFLDREDLVTQLKENKGALSEWFEKRYDDVDKIVLDSVASNTFRAFWRMPQKPSEVFRSWARRKLNDDEFTEQIGGFSSRKEYDQFIKEFSADFCDHWERHMGLEKRISYGPGRKLPNLLMKFVVLWRKLDDSQRSRLIDFLHIPFDSYSLSLLKNSIPMPLPVSDEKWIERIPGNVTMKFVATEVMYDELMSHARAVAEEANVPAIYIDVLAWDASH